MDGRINDGGPAFPRVPTQWGDGIAVWGEPGMTLRDYFAAKAMQALIQLFTTGNLTAKDGRPVTEEHIAEQAYCFADAMLKQREVGPDA